MNLVTALAQRPFALLWSGQTVSRLGDALYQIALILWVEQETSSPIVLGAAFACSFVPLAVFVLIGGVVGDRVSRVRLMLGSDLLRALVVGTLAVLATSHQLQVWHVYVASALFGTVDAFFQPAYAALLPDLTPRACSGLLPRTADDTTRRSRALY